MDTSPETWNFMFRCDGAVVNVTQYVRVSFGRVVQKVELLFHR